MERHGWEARFLIRPAASDAKGEQLETGGGIMRGGRKREVVVSETARRRSEAAIVAGAAAVLLFGFVYHPYIANATDTEAVAAKAAADTTRWGLAHLAIGVGYALAAVAFSALATYIHEAGEERWSSLARPFAVFGSALFVLLPGMEFAPLAAAETAGDPVAAQEELEPWFVPVIITAATTFAVGALAFALAIVRSGILDRQVARLVAAALVVIAVARFIPLGAAQIVIGIGAVVALWPVAYEMWRRPVPNQPGRSATITAA